MAGPPGAMGGPPPAPGPDGRGGPAREAASAPRPAPPASPRTRIAAGACLGLCLLVVLGAWRLRSSVPLDSSVLPISSRIYAAPPTLRVGAPADRDAVEAHLRRLGYRDSRDTLVAPGEFRLGRRSWVVGRRPFRLPDGLRPGGPLEVRLDRRGRVARLTAPDGRGLDTAWLEPELLRTVASPGGEERIPVALDEVPVHLVDAVLVTEDRRFHRHAGLDLLRIAAALVENLRRGEVVEGGSTLTQQLAKNLYLSPERTLGRKLREGFLALALEERYPKERLLEAYLNEVYLGQDGGTAIHGVGRAAAHYFGKDASLLEPAESALLAGMIRAPNLHSPLVDPESARARRDFVLRVMHREGRLPEAALAAALAAPVETGSRSPPEPTGGWFADFALERLATAVGEERLRRDGLVAFTTLDGRLQRAAEAAVGEGLRRLERLYPGLRRGGTPLQAALVALDPATGAVRALVGGRTHRRASFNRATAARRQPGSVFKPVVAVAALSPPARGRPGGDSPPDAVPPSSRAAPRPPFTLASLLRDTPLEVETAQGPWRPVNYDRDYRGEVTLRRALELSLNVPFARIGVELGPARIAAAARALGIESPLAPVPSLALGASEVTPLEMTRAYAALAAGGVPREPRPLLAVVGRGDGVGLPPPTSPGPGVDPAVAYLVTSVLRGAVDRGTAHGLREAGFGGPVAGKTGTTDGFRDAWFAGFTPGLAVGVWVGFDDGRSLGMTGSAAAVPIAADFLVRAEGRAGVGEFPRPAGLETVAVDPWTGRRAGPGCPGREELFLAGTAPEESCSWWDRFDDLEVVFGRDGEVELDAVWRSVRRRWRGVARQIEREMRLRLEDLLEPDRRR